MIIILIIFGVIFSILYYLQTGEFKQGHTTSITPREKSVCLGYGFSWNGPLNPIIKDIKFVDKHGQVIEELEKEKDALIYVNSSNPVGSIPIEDMKNYKLSSFKNHKLKNKYLDLAIVVNYSKIPMRSVEGIKIEYSILGIRKTSVMKVKFFKE